MQSAIDDFVIPTFFIAYVIGAIIYGLAFIGARPKNKFTYELISNGMFTVGCVALAWQWYVYYSNLKRMNMNVALGD